jgi:hypothetical protein
MSDYEPIHITIQGCPDDPRLADPPPGLIVHCSPPLHPDDIAEVDGIPVTSPARTLVDLADVLPIDELRECFHNAREIGLLDIEAVRASAARVEWRPSLTMLHQVIDEFEH